MKVVAGRRQSEKVAEVEEAEDDDFTRIADGIPVESRLIVRDIGFYEQMRSNDGTTRRAHIERHIVGSSHEDVRRTASSLGDTFDEVTASVADLFASSNPDFTREYLESRGGAQQIVRLSLMDDGHIEKTVIEAAPTKQGHFYITTLDSKTIRWALDKYGRKPR